MYHCIISGDRRGREGFTLFETMIAVFIALMVFSASWAIYYMAWRWWYEIAPHIEAQRIVRTALANIVDGAIEASAGEESGHDRRNGMAWAVYDPQITDGITADDTISFGLEQEKEDFGDYPTAHNARQFYLGVDEASGQRVVCYSDNAGNVTQIMSTLGITGLTFERSEDDGRICITVTARTERDVAGTGVDPYHIDVQYSDYVYLRNVI